MQSIISIFAINSNAKHIASHCDWMMTVSSWNIQQTNLFTIDVEWQLNNQCWNFIFTLKVFKRNNIILVSDLQRYTSLHMSSYLIFQWCILYFLCVIYISFGFIHLLRKSMRKYIHYSCNLSNYIQCTCPKKSFIAINCVNSTLMSSRYIKLNLNCNDL